MKYPPRDEDGEVFVWLLIPDRDDPNIKYSVLHTIPAEEYDYAMQNMERIDGADFH